MSKRCEFCGRYFATAPSDDTRHDTPCKASAEASSLGAGHSSLNDTRRDKPAKAYRVIIDTHFTALTGHPLCVYKFLFMV